MQLTVKQSAQTKRKISRKRYHQRTETKIANNIRKRLRKIIKDDGGHYTPETILLIGCDKPALRQHIQNQFLPGMTWENYGNDVNKWSIDHIIPLSHFDLFDTNEMMKANHYTNLRPLWHIDNMKKGSKLL